jgi:hypothetical protein
MSAVLYTRVPEALKKTLANYAASRGLSQTRAVVELLEQGLEASGGERSLADLEARLDRSQSEREATRVVLTVSARPFLDPKRTTPDAFCLFSPFPRRRQGSRRNRAQREDSPSQEAHRERGLGASPGCDERGHCAGAWTPLDAVEAKLGEAQRWDLVGTESSMVEPKAGEPFSGCTRELREFSPLARHPSACLESSAPVSAGLVAPGVSG